MSHNLPYPNATPELCILFSYCRRAGSQRANRPTGSHRPNTHSASLRTGNPDADLFEPISPTSGTRLSHPTELAKEGPHSAGRPPGRPTRPPLPVAVTLQGDSVIGDEILARARVPLTVGRFHLASGNAKAQPE
jgi:hypothetical protein